MKVSIVIPVYNEATALAACLEAIAAQTVAPHEVIVVDNNSSDGTASVARCFDFVTLLEEPRQGVLHARTRGFDAVRGDIIARIDADSLLPSDWVQTVQMILADPNVDAVSGSVSYYDMPFRRLVDRIDLSFRQRIANGMGDEVFLYGANMAIRRSAWRRARQQLCTSGGLHEDFDLAIHAEEAGARVIFDPRLHAAVSLRRFNTNLFEFWQYAWLNPKTYARHGRTSQRHMYPAVGLVIMFYWLIKLVYAAYDPRTETLSWRQLLLPMPPVRVNPATFVD